MVSVTCDEIPDISPPLCSPTATITSAAYVVFYIGLSTTTITSAAYVVFYIGLSTATITSAALCCVLYLVHPLCQVRHICPTFAFADIWFSQLSEVGNDSASWVGGDLGCGIHSATPPLGIGEPSGQVSGLGGCGHSATPPLGIGEPSGQGIRTRWMWTFWYSTFRHRWTIWTGIRTRWMWTFCYSTFRHRWTIWTGIRTVSIRILWLTIWTRWRIIGWKSSRCRTRILASIRIRDITNYAIFYIDNLYWTS